MKKENKNLKKTRAVVVAGIGDYTSEEITVINKCRSAIIDILLSCGYDAKSFDIIENEFIRSKEIILKKLKLLKPNFVFNLFEGFPGRAGSEADFVHMLEQENIKFTGNGSAALRTCLDKDKTKRILTRHGINTPYGAIIKDHSELSEIDPVFPFFVKPAFEDASLGICTKSYAPDMESLKESVNGKLSDFSEGLLVEEFIPGIEYNVGFFGGDNFELVGISALNYAGYPEKDSFLNFNGKWAEDSPEYENFMPRIIDETDPEYRKDVIDISHRAAKLLGCSGYFRVDLREKNGVIYVLDVNPNPDISPDSGFRRQANAKDLTYEEVIAKIAANHNRKNTTIVNKMSTV
ncbi:MAG: ATP-grasp domain-containing protein [Candidatus Omnitrophica bacterium]|nr:ATP-grasp domain-containing protein [Candidatus Omnitrophota bacterium]